MALSHVSYRAKCNFWPMFSFPLIPIFSLSSLFLAIHSEMFRLQWSFSVHTRWTSSMHPLVKVSFVTVLRLQVRDIKTFDFVVLFERNLLLRLPLFVWENKIKYENRTTCHVSCKQFWLAAAADVMFVLAIQVGKRHPAS